MTGVAAHRFPIKDGIHLLRVQQSLLSAAKALTAHWFAHNMACKVYIFHNADDFSKTAVDRPICGLCDPASRISCRRFVKENKNLKSALRLLPVLLAATFLSATAATAASIGVVAPQSGPFALLGKQMQDAAALAPSCICFPR
ncbi:MAG: hypothetical protein QMD99_08610, partial [Rhizobiaceae bacterium]|nr:hypothetical protein [Rhizobiaceae bacterium]